MRRPFKTELGENGEQHLEVQNLFVADDPDLCVGLVLFVLEQRRSDVLRDVDAGSVGAENDLCAEFAEICNDCAVFAFLEHAVGESLCDEVLAEQIGLAFEICFVEMNAHAVIRLLESGEDP